MIQLLREIQFWYRFEMHEKKCRYHAFSIENGDGDDDCFLHVPLPLSLSSWNSAFNN